MTTVLVAAGITTAIGLVVYGLFLAAAAGQTDEKDGRK